MLRVGFRNTLDPGFECRGLNMVTGLLGSTGLVVSRIGVGLAALGRPAYINLGRERDLGANRTVADLERRCHELLDAAYAAGIRYIDAARSYGMAEAFLASWLTTRCRLRDDLTIGSKWGYAYVGSWRLDSPVHEVKDLSVRALRRQIAESRTLLGDRLRLYQIHSATLDSVVLDDAEVLLELQRLRGEGLAVGLSVSGPRQADSIRYALEVEVNGAPLFQVVQATWNLLEPSAGTALAEAKARGLGVIVKEPLANGRLTDQHFTAPLSVLKRLADTQQTTIDALAIAAALSQRWSDVVLSGAVTTNQLQSNVNAATLSERSLEWPEMSEQPIEYWRRRSTLPWR
jgi:aryl-alcohol dehydrogenase-like predicted oxidoreductase